MQAQILLTIDTVIVYNAIVVDNDSIIDEDEENGPQVLFNCNMKNICDSTVVLSLNTASLYLTYNYKGEVFSLELNPVLFYEKDNIEIESADSFDLDIDSYLFLGTKLFEYKKTEYMKILAQILPTISIIYKDNNIAFSSCGINMVTLHSLNE